MSALMGCSTCWPGVVGRRRVRDDLRDYVLAGLGDTGAVLVVDETGDVKKGVHTVGVQCQYTGPAGRIENAQVGVYLAYATDAGHALIDRELYLPRSWTTDTERVATAGVPGDISFATKPALATRMIVRALDTITSAWVPAPWVTGDEVYGNDPRLRGELETRRVGYVLAVACSHHIVTGAGKLRADQITDVLPARGWQRLPAGLGAKGSRLYDWALIDIDEHADEPEHRWLLIRRNPASGELAYYRCYAPEPTRPGRPTTDSTACAGQPGEDDTNTGPDSATTDGEPPHAIRPDEHEDHDLRLEY